MGVFTRVGGFGIGGYVNKPNGNPSALFLTVDSDTQMSGIFTIGSTNHDGHKVFISTDGIDFTETTVTWNATNSFTKSGLTANQEYWFYVVAYKGSKLSLPSNIVNDSTNSLQITNFSAYPYTGGVRITWTDIPANIGDVLIYRSTDGGDFVEVGSVAVGTQVYEDAITGDHVLVYKLRAIIAPYTYCTEYQAVYDQYTTKPSTEVAYNMDLMYRKLVSDGTWDTISGGWIFAVHTNDNSEALINIKNPSGDKGILVNSPVFTQYEGFVGDVANSRGINLKWNETDDDSISSLNNFGVIVGTLASGSAGRLFGRARGSNSYTTIVFNGTGMIHSNFAATGTNYGNNFKKYISHIRSASNVIKQYSNKSASVDSSTVSTNKSDKDWGVLCNNTSATDFTAGDFCNGKISILIAGIFNETQKNLIIDAIDAYMVSNGKGIL